MSARVETHAGFSITVLSRCASPSMQPEPAPQPGSVNFISDHPAHLLQM